MDHTDHVGLLRGGVKRAGGTWAEVGAGRGAFTLALADLLGPGGRIVAVDRDAAALATNGRSVRERFPTVSLATVEGDFTHPLELPELDGIVAANSLHFVPRAAQAAVVRRLATHLRPGAPFLIVEYDVDRGTPWVPHPFTFETWREIAADAGLVMPARLGRVRSRWLGGIYSAVARHPTSAEDSRA